MPEKQKGEEVRQGDRTPEGRAVKAFQGSTTFSVKFHEVLFQFLSRRLHSFPLLLLTQ